MKQDWYSQFLGKITQELVDHIAEDMQKIALPLLGSMSIESLLNDPRFKEMLKQFGSIGFRAPGQCQGAEQMATDYCYRILGLDKSASDDEVKKRYRDLVKKLHPDVAGQETAQLFMLVQMAFEQIARERGWRKSEA
jgi:DnaJ-domain-containing protein 1